MRHLFLRLSLVTVLVAAPLSARAAPPEVGADLKRQGDEAMDALHYEEAIAKYTAALEVSADPALYFNRGRVYEARSQFPEALADIERFDREAPPALRGRVQGLPELLVSLRAKVATLAVKSNVEGARVLVRGQQIGATPIAPFKLNAGRAVIEVIADGYLPFRREVDLAGAAVVNVDAPLVSRERAGTLAVRTTGVAEIFIDGKSVGAPPLEVGVEAGTHKILVRSTRYSDKETTAVVVAGQRRDVVIELEERPGLTSRWWFWSGLAVVVVGGVVTTVALLTEKPAPQGDQFAPGQVRAPLVRW